jgi:hypothetical protein
MWIKLTLVIGIILYGCQGIPLQYPPRSSSPLNQASGPRGGVSQYIPASQTDFIPETSLESPDPALQRPEINLTPDSGFNPSLGSITVDSKTLANQFRVLEVDSDLLLAAVNNYFGTPEQADDIKVAQLKFDADVDQTIRMATGTRLGVLDGIKAQPSIIKFIKNVGQGASALSNKKALIANNGGDWYFYTWLKRQKVTGKQLQIALNTRASPVVKGVASAEFNYLFKELDDSIAVMNPKPLRF